MFVDARLVTVWLRHVPFDQYFTFYTSRFLGVCLGVGEDPIEDHVTASLFETSSTISVAFVDFNITILALH